MKKLTYGYGYVPIRFFITDLADLAGVHDEVLLEVVRVHG